MVWIAAYKIKRFLPHLITVQVHQACILVSWCPPAHVQWWVALWFRVHQLVLCCGLDYSGLQLKVCQTALPSLISECWPLSAGTLCPAVWLVTNEAAISSGLFFIPFIFGRETLFSLSILETPFWDPAAQMASSPLDNFYLQFYIVK